MVCNKRRIHFSVNVENANTFLNISKYEQPYSKCITIFPFFAFRAIVPRVYRDISFHVRDNGRFEIEVELPITERERENIYNRLARSRRRKTRLFPAPFHRSIYSLWGVFGGSVVPINLDSVVEVLLRQEFPE